ncbi:MAG: PD-(D/E)XK nuclease family protein [Syntrophobacteraceae bacterium]
MTNRDLQNRLIDLLESGHTVLAETERFVHQARQKFRRKKLDSGLAAWDSPAIFTLNRWLDSFWSESWADEWPASHFTRWRLLRECLDHLPPPGPISPDMGLVHLLDESFEHLLRYGMDPGRGEAGNRLIEWRREIWRLFSGELSRAGLFHPAQLPQKILDIFDRLPRPASRMAFAGFEFAGYWEKKLLGALQKATGAEFFPLPIGCGQPAETLAFSDPGQEITGLMENLLASAAGLPLHEIAVVALDSEFYSPAIANGLEDILGEPLAGTRAAYNLSPDRDLAGEPLFHAALLPLRFAAGGRMRRDLFTLLRSPYYGFFSRWSRKLAHWDRVWRNERIDSGLDALLGAVRSAAGEIFAEGGREIGAALAPFLANGGKTASFWAENLRRLWTRFEFPVVANDLDEISRQGLDDLLGRFENDFGRTEITVSEFTELLTSAASRVRVQKTGLEDAGIQVLGRLDARGLAFSKVFVPGLVSGALPQPVRALPLLGPSERKRVLGGTPESQFTFARYLFGNLRASAPEITLSRPAMNREGEISLPSPFWPRESEQKRYPVIPWKDPLPAMQRAEWVQQSISGMPPEQGEPFLPGPEDFRMSPLPFTEPVAVSALHSAILCPALFIFRHILRLEELPEIEAGIPPLERGQKIHEILASFVSRAGPDVRSGDATLDDLAKLLEKVVREKLAPHLFEASWQVELDRLTGRPDFPGLLHRWLEEEWKSIEEGWSWLAVESPFTGMDLAGCAARLKGRLDRIDRRPDQGLICWDYKTGSIPARKDVRENYAQPQLPAYLLAVSRGLVRGVGAEGGGCVMEAGGGAVGGGFGVERGVGVERGGCGAGYVDLSTPGNVRRLLFFDPAEDNAASLSEWEKTVAAALNRIAAGDISPLWLEANNPCEEKCPYREICGAP